MVHSDHPQVWSGLEADHPDAMGTICGCTFWGALAAARMLICSSIRSQIQPRASATRSSCSTVRVGGGMARSRIMTANRKIAASITIQVAPRAAHPAIGNLLHHVLILPHAG
jgi:hypothetical protein